MSHYPEGVEKIVQDYLQRVAIQLRRFPKFDQEEVLKELGSHIYESYCAGSDPDPVGRILDVLRKLGEPADVVAERLQESLLNVGKLKRVPLSVLGGIVVGMFGLPLGFAGVAILLGGLAPSWDWWRHFSRQRLCCWSLVSWAWDWDCSGCSIQTFGTTWWHRASFNSTGVSASFSICSHQQPREGFWCFCSWQSLRPDWECSG